MRRAARLGASRSRSPGGSVGAGSPLPGKRGDRHAPRGHRGTARDRPPQRGADGRTDGRTTTTTTTTITTTRDGTGRDVGGRGLASGRRRSRGETGARREDGRGARRGAGAGVAPRRASARLSAAGPAARGLAGCELPTSRGSFYRQKHPASVPRGTGRGARRVLRGTSYVAARSESSLWNGNKNPTGPPRVLTRCVGKEKIEKNRLRRRRKSKLDSFEGFSLL